MTAQDQDEITTESTIKEIAAVLRSTDKMADAFAQRVQERVGQPVPFTYILAVMQEIRPSMLTMAKVVTKLRREL
jgi:hypothetical protein